MAHFVELTNNKLSTLINLDKVLSIDITETSVTFHYSLEKTEFKEMSENEINSFINMLRTALKTKGV